MGLSCDVICVILRLAILIQYRRVTDTHTHTQTDRHTTTVYTVLSIASRGNNQQGYAKHFFVELGLTFLAVYMAYLKALTAMTLGVYTSRSFIDWRLQSFSNGTIRSCKISTDKLVVRSLCNKRVSCEM